MNDGCREVGGVVIIEVSGGLWKSNGRVSCHSIADGWWCDEITFRCATNLSHRMKMKRRRAIKEIIDPREEITFHLVNASG